MYGPLLLLYLVCTVEVMAISVESNSTTTTTASACKISVTNQLEVVCSVFIDVGQTVDNLIEVKTAFIGYQVTIEFLFLI